jgi:putative transposase
MKEAHSIRTLCETLRVSPSGFYAWDRRCTTPGPRAQADQGLASSIKAIHAASRQTYGRPRIQQALRQQDTRHGCRRIARLMRAAGLCGRPKARYRVRTTDSNHDHPIAPNQLGQATAATGPNQQWVADITYIQTQAGWLYLAAVLDLYSRKIVGWAMSQRIDTPLVLKALGMALRHRQPTAPLLCHSDRGAQYAAADYRQALTDAGLRASMSRKGNCYDNATMESFWSTLKWELVYRRDFASHAQAQAAIFDYIEAFYNRQRSHSALNFLSPVDFEAINN